MNADKNNERANSINVKAMNKMGAAYRLQAEQEEKTIMSLEKLVNRKRGILNGSMKKFLEVYQQIQKINFKESQGIKELYSQGITKVEITELKQMIQVSAMPLSTAETMAAYLFKGFGGISGIILKESEINISIASIRKKMANVIVSQVETKCVAIEAVYQRSEKLAEVLAKLNRLFLKNILTIEEILEAKGTNPENYEEKDMATFMNCVNFAGAIKNIIDTPLLELDGNLVEQSEKAIMTGEKYLNMMINEVC